MAGGSKGVPANVATNQQWFVTLTGPSFGRVHGDSCARRRANPRRCDHGRPVVCQVDHEPDANESGTPLCVDCYDYVGAVAFNWFAPELWRRFAIGVRRALAKHFGLSESRLRQTLCVAFAKVAEFQVRGVVHFHAVIRLDGAGDSFPSCPITLADNDMQQCLRDAVDGAAFDVSTDSGPLEVAFGNQLDVRQIVTVESEFGATPSMVAAYIAKYATKAAEDFGLSTSIRTSGIARSAGLSNHVVAMIDATENLARTDKFLGLHRWIHMLGFRGHFTTKSRRFSTTLTALRTHRKRWREDRDNIPAAERSGSWQFVGLGYASAGDAELAAGARADAAEARWLSRISHD